MAGNVPVSYNFCGVASALRETDHHGRCSSEALHTTRGALSKAASLSLNCLTPLKLMGWGTSLIPVSAREYWCSVESTTRTSVGSHHVSPDTSAWRVTLRRWRGPTWRVACCARHHGGGFRTSVKRVRGLPRSNDYRSREMRRSDRSLGSRRSSQLIRVDHRGRLLVTVTL